MGNIMGMSMKYTSDKLENMMAKARLLGKAIGNIPTKCGHTMYILKDILDGAALLYIPDDVETVKEDDQSGIWLGLYPTYCNIECKTLIVYGGRNLKDANGMFSGCKAQSLDLSNFDTSKVTNMSDMFRGCKAESIDLSSFDTSNVADMRAMFYLCEAQSLDLSSFDTSKGYKEF